jgi:SsrA-binding protein
MKNLITNRKAYYEYHISETLSCGIQLNGSEIRPIKESKTSINEAYCYISEGELFIKGMYVAPHNGNIKNYTHDTNRDRKLLVKKISYTSCLLQLLINVYILTKFIKSLFSFNSSKFLACLMSTSAWVTA